MSVTLEKGYCDALKTTLLQLAQENNPSTKITPSGFFRAIVENQPSIGIPEYEKLRLNSQMGNVKQVRVIYRPRLAKGETSTIDDCDNDGIPFKKESLVDVNGFRKYSFIIPTTELEQYCEESTQLAQGGQASPLLREHVTRILEVAAGLVADINDDLLGMIAWGTNAKYGDSLAHTLNINANSSVNRLDTGFTRLLTDLRFNEVSGAPIIVGAGIMDSFDQMRLQAMLGLAQNGQNSGAFAQYKYYYDLYASTVWTNDNNNYDQVGVFAPGTIGFVDLDRFLGFKAGQLGASYFTQLPVPLDVIPGANTPTINFDVQVKFLDCPTEVGDGYGGLTTVNRAWQIIISKKFGLWQMPADAYSSGDRLAGVNGAFRYNLTNKCEDCEAEESNLGQ